MLCQFGFRAVRIFSPILSFSSVAFKLLWSSDWSSYCLCLWRFSTDHNKNTVGVFKCSITYRCQFIFLHHCFSQSLLFIIEKHIRPLYHLILLCCFISLFLSVCSSDPRAWQVSLCAEVGKLITRRRRAIKTTPAGATPGSPIMQIRGNFKDKSLAFIPLYFCFIRLGFSGE